MLSGTRTQVKLEMGYDRSPEGFVIEARKSEGMTFAAAAAAAEMLEELAMMKFPAEFCIRPQGSRSARHRRVQRNQWNSESP